MNCLKLINRDWIHPDWTDFITDELTGQVAGIENLIANGGFTPPGEKVLRFMAQPLLSAKIIILGQDPYPQPGVATGRAFEVGNLVSWNQPFSNISVKNILRAVYKAYTGKIMPFGELKSKFDNEFPLLGPAALFSHWEMQGIILLNTTFTCEPGKPGSHRKIWERFSRELLTFIHKKNKSLLWLLWGTDALNAVIHLDGIQSIASFHPMMCFEGSGRENDFLYGEKNGFAETKDLIDWTGYANKIPPPGRQKLLFDF